MKNIYLVRYMGVQAFSSAQKAIAHIKSHHTGWEMGPYGETVVIETIPNNELVKALKNGEILIIESGRDQAEIFQTIIQ